MYYNYIITTRGELITSSIPAQINQSFFILKNDPNNHQLWQKNLTTFSKSKRLENFKKQFLKT